MLPQNFSLDKYSCELYEWYSPVFVIQCYDELFRRYPGKDSHTFFKKANEAMQAAVALLGARALHEDNIFLMQMNRQSRRPDVIAATRLKYKGAPTLSISPLELTELELHTNHEDLAKFLIDKKLAKDYPPETMFICYINKILEFDIRDLSARIRTTGKKNPIYIFGKTKGTAPMNFFIGSPQPIVANTRFDLAEQSRDYPEKERMTLTEDKTNMNPVIVPYRAQPIDLLDFFMLNRSRIEKVFGTLRPSNMAV